MTKRKRDQHFNFVFTLISQTLHSLTPPPLPRFDYQNSSPVVDPTVLHQLHPLASLRLAIFFHHCRVSLSSSSALLRRLLLHRVMGLSMSKVSCCACAQCAVFLLDATLVDLILARDLLSSFLWRAAESNSE
jgi:hypothetical protein